MTELTGSHPDLTELRAQQNYKNASPYLIGGHEDYLHNRYVQRCPGQVTLLRLPNPILCTADVFHSGSGGTNCTAGGCCFSTPKGSVQSTASHL